MDTSSKSRLLIVSHAPSPNTQALTEAVRRGAADAEPDDVIVRVIAPLEADESDVLWAQGIVLGTTENFGYMSGGLKDFFDRIYYPCLERTQGLPYALFVKGGQDGRGAQAAVERIVAGLRWREVQAPLIMSGAFRREWLQRCEATGTAMAAGLALGIF